MTLHPNDAALNLLSGADFITTSRERQISEPGRTWGVVAIDLGNLRVFNEWYGREKGNELLSSVATYLAELQRKDDAVAGYWGEDDFSVFGSIDSALVESIFSALSGIIAQHDASLGFRPAFGVYLLNPDERMGMDCYTCAAFAVRQAKTNLHRPINYFKEHRSQEPNNDFKILSCFHKAIFEGEVYPEVQPQVDIHTGKMVGAEALARWRKKDGGMRSPLLASFPFLSEQDSSPSSTNAYGSR